jgi:predicted dehydrogenase
MPAPGEPCTPLGIAVAGLGRAGTWHLERIGLREDCRLVAAYDACRDASQKAAGLADRFAATWRDLLHDDAVDLVLLATPPASHAELALEALAAGKHVLVETPLCLNLIEADAIQAAERRAARSVIVAHTRRWDDDFRAALECLRSGALGKPSTIKHICWQYNPHRRDSGASRGDPRSDHPTGVASRDWRDDRSTGGGALWELGVHYFDQLLHLAREFPTSISVETYAEPGSDRVDEGFLALVRFSSGLRAHIEVNRASPVPLQTGWVVVGDGGSYAAGTQFTVTADGEVVDEPLAAVNGQIDDFYAAIVRHLRSGAPNPVSTEEARRGIAIIDAAQCAARTGRPAPIDG